MTNVNLPPGYSLSAPLVASSWGIPATWETVEELGLVFRVLPHYWSDDPPLVGPYDEPGTYCVFGEALGCESYSQVLSEAPGLTVQLRGEAGGWFPQQHNVVAVQFELTLNQGMTVDFSYAIPGALLQRGKKYLVVLTDEAPEQLLGQDPSISDVGLDGAGAWPLIFQVHGHKVEELTPYDFCVGDIRFVVRDD
jgi:hypothetical protein